MAGKPNDVPPRVRVRRGPKKGRYDRESIDAVLDRGLLAHVAFADGDGAVCIPMLYARVGDTVYIHGSTASRAVRLLGAGAPACITVTLVHALVLARSAFEHSANYDSVMVFGRFALQHSSRPAGGVPEQSTPCALQSRVLQRQTGFSTTRA